MNTILSFRTHVRNLMLSFFDSFIASVTKQSLFLSLRAYIIGRLPGVCQTAIFVLFFFTLPCLAFAQEKIPVFPTTQVEAYTVYGSLAILWLGIIWLIVVIKMKLNEIERIQKLGLDEENSETPILD